MTFQGRHVLHGLVCSMLLLGGSNGVFAAGSEGSAPTSESDNAALNSPSAAKMAVRFGLTGGFALGLVVLMIELQAKLGAALGARELKPETQEEIRKVLREMGLKDVDDVCLAECIEALQKAFPKHGAAALMSPFGGNRRILLTSEEAFGQLSEDEKRFLVGHEATHIKRQHVLKAALVGVGAALCALLPSMCVAQSYGRKKEYLKAGAVGAVGYLSALVCAILGRAAMSRANEREADCQAARELNAAAGGVAIMKRFKEDPVMQAVLKKYKSFWWRLLMAHPTLDERIAYLQKIAEEQAAQAAARA